MKKFLIILAFVLPMLFVSACGAAAPQPQSQPDSSQEEQVLIEFTDALGQNIVLKEHPQKVAGVVGSFADVWLLAGGEMVAATQDVIDEGLVAESDVVNLGLLKSPSVEKMIEQGIDFAILSASLVEHVALKEQLSDAGITAAYFDVEVFDDYLDVLQKFCTITGRDDLYEKNGTSIRRQIDDAVAKKEGKPSPTVLFLRAFSSGVKAKGSDSMTGAMLRDLGCTNIADSEKNLLEDLSMEVIISQDPDFIFVVTMGESSEKAMASVDKELIANPAWSGLSAVKNGRYKVIPKELFHLKPNDRWGESYEMLAEILYGE